MFGLVGGVAGRSGGRARGRRFDAGVLHADGRRATVTPGYRFSRLAAAAGKLLAADAGPRIAALRLEGWETHANQTALLARSTL
ncbi:MAG: hypothetical protein ACREFP_15810 [Acetobacteraceae bacterium]